jgi:putative (di)nucleoside polyphosphate hydrolase
MRCQRAYAVGIMHEKRLTFRLGRIRSIPAQIATSNQNDTQGRQTTGMIDPDGYRPNVAIVLMNQQRRVFWAQRSNSDGWQFPQGGMRSDETPVEAMYRELNEETGLAPNHVELLGATPGWLRYRLPRRYQRHYSKPLCIGQKQVWFLLRFLADDSVFSLNLSDEPEFTRFQWVDFWYPVDNVITFKRSVYRQALSLLEPMAQTETLAG